MEEAQVAQRQAEARGEQETKSAIQSFGPTAISQLADALTIRIPRPGAAGSMPAGTR
jgi:hypothetical protein